MTSLARTPQQVGNTLRRARQSLKLTQQDIGARTHLRQATISKLESGEPGVRLGTLFDVLAALDLELVIQPRSKSSPADIEANF